MASFYKEILCAEGKEKKVQSREGTDPWLEKWAHHCGAGWVAPGTTHYMGSVPIYSSPNQS